MIIYSESRQEKLILEKLELRKLKIH